MSRRTVENETDRDRYPAAESPGNLAEVAGKSNGPATETFRVSAEIPVAVDAETVFGYVSDLSRSGEWSPECQGGTWVRGRPSEVGSVFRGHNVRTPDVVSWAPVVRGEWTTESEVVESRAPHVFSWAMRDGAGRAQQSVWSFEVRPADGGSVLTHAFWMGELTEGMRGIFSRMSDSEESTFVAEWTEKIGRDLRTSLLRIRSALEPGTAG